MIKPIIHPASELTLTLVMKSLPHALLLTGPVGVGLNTIAQYIAQQTKATTFIILPEKDDKIDIEKGVISIDSIRRLYTQTRGIQKEALIIIIDYAERMGRPAQNAFLKLLEEPGSNIHFILATHSPSKLLSTITSRAQLLDIRPTTHTQSEKLLDTLVIKNAQKRTQLLFMADGLPAELTRLASDDEYFQSQATIVRDARDLLQGTTYKRLVIAHRYKDNRQAALTLLTYASSILRRSISEKPQPSLIAQIDALLYAYQQVEANGNIRLCIARLVV
jgi:hypothetical protein